MLHKFKAGPMFIIGVLFFVFGFVSWLNAILIPYFKLSLQLSLSASMFVAFAFYISYFIMALPASWLLQRLGFKKGMVAGLCIMAIGAALFIPAAYGMNFLTFLAGLFVQATGLTILQTAANPYVTVLGPLERAATRMSIMGVCNKVAGALAPILFMHIISKHPDEIDQIQTMLASLSVPEQQDMLGGLTQRLILPYGAMAVILLLLGLFIQYSGLPDIKEDDNDTVTTSQKGLFHFPHLMLGIVAIFCSVGIEVLAIDSIIGYAGYQGYPFAKASYFATYVLLIMIGSYLLGIALIPKYLNQRKALMLCAGIGTTLTALAIVLPGYLSIWCIALLGFANALIWPSIWPLALDGLGSYTKRGSALLIMGIVGGALIPPLYGMLGGWISPQFAYIIMIPLYVYLLYFGRYGSRIRTGPHSA